MCAGHQQPDVEAEFGGQGGEVDAVVPAAHQDRVQRRGPGRFGGLGGGGRTRLGRWGRGVRGGARRGGPLSGLRGGGLRRGGLGCGLLRCGGGLVRALGEQALGDLAGVLLAHRAPGQPHFAFVQAEQIRHHRVAAHGHGEGGQGPRTAGLGLVEESLCTADLVIAAAKRLCEYRVALPQLPRFHDCDNVPSSGLDRFPAIDHCIR
ncbi:hypothetical protein Srufu_071830 [Streptomyces libani subsp. rufus]|nr:hypothetical protein Srufu_071830 [Streptomyces libani subsp. rufus]